jgi:hypothetical protein
MVNMYPLMMEFFLHIGDRGKMLWKPCWMSLTQSTRAGIKNSPFFFHFPQFIIRRSTEWVATILLQQSQVIYKTKVDLLQDSHKLLLTPYREFERQFGGKTVLAGLRLKKQLMVVSKITFQVWNLFRFFSIASGDFYFSAPVRPTRLLRRHSRIMEHMMRWS